LDLRRFWEGRVKQNPEKVFIYYQGDEITYASTDVRINQRGNAFLKLGVKKGDRVCLMLPNTPEFIYSWFGLAKIGAAMVPINTSFKATEAQYVVNHSEAIGLIVNNAFLDVALKIKNGCPNLKWIAVTESETPPEGIIHLEKLAAGMSSRLKRFALKDEDIAAIIYTSGTTGFPKGAMHVHSSFPLTGEAFILCAGLVPDDRLMVILPFYHVNAEFYSTMGAIAVGASLVIIRDFSASRFWEQAVRYGVTQFNFIGAVGRMLMARSDAEFHKEHRIRVMNGAGIPEADYQAFVNRFHIPYVIDGYGLTECPRVCQIPIGGPVKMGSMGLPAKHPSVKFTEMKIVDDNGCELPPGKTGELVVRSPVLMRGYFHDAVKTKDAIRDSWFYTGDYAYKDEDGYYYFVDRKKDIIRRRGENISAREVETVINENPNVVETAVIAVPSALGEDEVMACIVLKQGQSMTAEEVVLWCKDKIANFKVPRYVQFRDSFPKTATQRTQKNVIKEEEYLLTKSKDMEIFKRSLYI
jgi:crotonobetaine/carnitine-CoA ligase